MSDADLASNLATLGEIIGESLDCNNTLLLNSVDYHFFRSLVEEKSRRQGKEDARAAILNEAAQTNAGGSVAGALAEHLLRQKVEDLEKELAQTRAQHTADLDQAQAQYAAHHSRAVVQARAQGQYSVIVRSKSFMTWVQAWIQAMMAHSRFLNSSRVLKSDIETVAYGASIAVARLEIAVTSLQNAHGDAVAGTVGADSIPDFPQLPPLPPGHGAQ